MSINKQELRREVLRRLKAAAAADPAQLRSAALRKKLATVLEGSARCVGIYAPLPHEVNLLPLLHEYPQHSYAFPRCLPERKLQFCIVRHLEDDLEPGAMGIPAPAHHTRKVAPSEIDILIVPGVAFTPQGDRMGYGGGYYDSFIPQCTNARVIALAFDEQLEHKLPVEEHDLCIPELITNIAT